MVQTLEKARFAIAAFQQLTTEQRAAFTSAARTADPEVFDRVALVSGVPPHLSGMLRAYIQRRRSERHYRRSVTKALGQSTAAIGRS